jgi:hypothetical protein
MLRFTQRMSLPPELWTFALRLSLAGLLAAMGCGATAPPRRATTPAPTPSGLVAWPPLPAAFITGRSATQEDVAQGKAVFATRAGNSIPLPIAIPQYAFCELDGTRVPGLVVQAEQSQGLAVAGFRPLSGAPACIVPMDTCKMLGQTAPDPDESKL